MWNPLASYEANIAHEEMYAPRYNRNTRPVTHVDSKGWEWAEPHEEEKGTTDWCYE